MVRRCDPVPREIISIRGYESSTPVKQNPANARRMDSSDVHSSEDHALNAPKKSVPKKARKNKPLFVDLEAGADGDPIDDDDDVSLSASEEAEEAATALDGALAVWEEVLMMANDAKRLLGFDDGDETADVGALDTGAEVRFGAVSDLASRVDGVVALNPNQPIVLQEKWLSQVVPKAFARLRNLSDTYGSVNIGEHYATGADLLKEDIFRVVQSVRRVALSKITQLKGMIAQLENLNLKIKRAPPQNTVYALYVAKKLSKEADAFREIVMFYAAGPVYAAQAAAIARAKSKGSYKQHARSSDIESNAAARATRDARKELRELVGRTFNDANLENAKAKFAKEHFSKREKLGVQVKWLRRLLQPPTKSVSYKDKKKRAEAYSETNGVVGGGIDQHTDPEPEASWARKNEELWLSNAKITNPGRFAKDKAALRKLLTSKSELAKDKAALRKLLTSKSEHIKADSEPDLTPEEYTKVLALMQNLRLEENEVEALRVYVKQKEIHLDAARQEEGASSYTAARENAACTGPSELYDFLSDRQRRQNVKADAVKHLAGSGDVGRDATMRAALDRISKSWTAIVKGLDDATCGRVERKPRKRLRPMAEVDEDREERQDTIDQIADAEKFLEREADVKRMLYRRSLKRASKRSDEQDVSDAKDYILNERKTIDKNDVGRAQISVDRIWNIMKREERMRYIELAREAVSPKERTNRREGHPASQRRKLP